MRIPKELLIAAVLLAVSIWDVQPRMAEYATMQDKLLVLKRQLAKEQLFATQHDQIEAELQAAIQAHQDNSKRMFPADIAVQVAMNQLQEMLKQELQSLGLEVLSFRWGEPFRKEKANYLTLPVSFTASGNPGQAARFFKEVNRLDKMLTCRLVNITKGKKESLTLDVTITGFQFLSEGK